MTYMDKVELLAKMENVLDVPSGERLTQWYGDYSIYEPKPNVTQTDIEKRIQQLDVQIDHSKTIRVEIRRNVDVENSKSIEEAIEEVMRLYKSGDLVLDEEDFHGVEYDLSEDIDFDMEM